MTNLLSRYTDWLHTRWPSGTVERLPEAGAHGETAVPGLFIVGDLTGIPLLKFAADSGARAVQHIAATRPRASSHGELDLIIVGAGIGGMAAALEASHQGLSCAVVEASEPFSTIVNFPRRKPIFAYPTQMRPAGRLAITAEVKEDLLDELRSQAAAANITPVLARVEQISRSGDHLQVLLADGEPMMAPSVIIAIGRSGNYRRLGCQGEELPKVSNRLIDPTDFAGQNILVVGGGDSAAEAAMAIAQGGGRVTLSYRGKELSRPKPENAGALAEMAAAGGEGGKDDAPHGTLSLRLGTEVREIAADTVVLRNAAGRTDELANDAVLTMIGREAPLDFLRRSGARIRGEWLPRTWLLLLAVLAAAVFVYHWKTAAGIPVKHWFQNAGLFPYNLPAPAHGRSLLGTLRLSMAQPSLYYSAAYCLAVIGFGIQRMLRRRTPYVRRQTMTLMAVQCLPLFVLPYLLLPWAGHNGWFAPGTALQPMADALFPHSEWSVHGREYWRALGFILAWPLFIWNVFTPEPMWGWLMISLVQAFVIIPLLVWRWGKGAYCGWICSCGALAETMGDAQRHKMPHGPRWNRLNMVGQAVLLSVLLLLLLRVAGWLLPSDHAVNSAYMALLLGKTAGWAQLPFPFSFTNYVWFVDLFMAGILGVGLYWHFSGRVWCRFGCPLAALMHVYARFGQFRIFADKKKCISCNVCTGVCHQGIDVMAFASRGTPMQDPQCVRCSACVEACPTGVLAFGRTGSEGAAPRLDRIQASPIRAREAEVGETGRR
jgi:NosR/NirI family transcriptional regulator, nitrous oxide reductase regulator